ncbi:sigma-E factor negative regulatory protein [Neisseria chenwenguii]|uniref:Anti-sigma factor n=1 Tax=Neisseria chenwenguii TaxID=1853278 RepID=A0A220S4N2_9NEIS|nr:sigma-E factor negative regulatory protein [Neisseria chenwenguii]ASK28303.1 anti-sigma factor [Neisseria chenwenguii]ROV55472.1 anti-sigma factor [Neisseria chenwenguii]
MNTTINETYEYVSIAADDEELSEVFIDRLLNDDEAARKWYEYHLIGDCIRNEREAAGRDAGFLKNADFQAALAEISAEHQARSGNTPKAAAKPAEAANHTFKGFAVAASLAAVAVSVWQFWPQADQGATPVAAEQTRPADNNVVSVGGHADKTASAPVVPNASKDTQTTESRSAVGVEANKAAQQQLVH